MKKLNWQGISGEGRHKMIAAVRDAIDDQEGCIINFNILSDLQLFLMIEIPENKISALYQTLEQMMTISPMNGEHLNSKSTKEWVLFLNISFSTGSGNLRVEVPEVPG